MDTHEESETIKMLSSYELIQYFQNGLSSHATGGKFDRQIYQEIRSKIIKNTSFNKYVPAWVKTCRDPDQFWGFIKGKFSTYEERRQYIRNEFSSLLDFLKSKTSMPIDESISFNESHIHEQWKKALERKNSDPEGAITTARTLIESILKYILDEKNIEYNDNTDLSELYKEVAKSLNLAPEQHQEQIFKQILGGANGIISGLGSLRNKLGDAHGKGKMSIKPKERHGELAVNLAGTMALFLYKTFKEQENK
ncbi:MAG: abortive infection family protein [Sulfurovum sp.]|nr:abortive infection family protein [Sulfurovum sp.]MCB4764841.1 abortive infection family protein [Sulfurovum sp.]